MKTSRTLTVALALSTAALFSARAHAETFTLDAPSSSLPAVPAGVGDLLRPSLPPPAPPPPVLGISAANLGLLPGDVIDAITYFDDGPVPGSTLFFSVTRTATSAAGPPGDVFFEQTAHASPEAASDMFSIFDPTCPLPPGFNTQVLDGDGAATAAFCYSGLSQGLIEVAPPPTVDNINSFEWGWPGQARLGCAGISLAAGSPSLVAGANPLAPAGMTAAHVVVVCPSNPPFAPALFPAFLPADLGLAAGDDIDALVFSGGVVAFSLAPGSPTLGAFALSAADVLGGFPPFGPPPPVLVPAPALGLIAADDVNALESFVNPAPVVPATADAPDFDGIGPGDNCPGTFNIGQNDMDFDGMGDSCDPCTDTDADLAGNPGFPNLGCATDNCQFVPNGLQLDSDGDGLGEGCDDCTNVAGARNFIFPPVRRIILKRVNTNTIVGDDILVVRGVFNNGVLFAALNPLAEGASLVIRNSSGGTKLNQFIPAGAFVPGFGGWDLNAAATRWRYRATAAFAFNGIRRMIIRDLGGGNVRVVIRGVNGVYPLNAADMPLTATVGLGNQLTADGGGCGETGVLACVLNGPGNSIRCGP